MKLVDLFPRWVSDSSILPDRLTAAGGPFILSSEDSLALDGTVLVGKRRQGMGLSFECPHCVLTNASPDTATRLAIAFSNPIDGEPPAAHMKYWTRIGGTTFADLSISPSIDASGTGHWHGELKNGEVT